MRTIKDETELPYRRRETSGHQWFLRSKSCPTVLIEYHDGDCFTREDGANWQYPAYGREKNRDGTWEALLAKDAICDDKIYPYTKAKAA